MLEILAVKSGGNSTISEALWRLWAEQPWVILIASHALLGPAWYLAGHFTSQSATVYEAIRRGINLDAALLLASEALASYRLAKTTGNGQEPLTVTFSSAASSADHPSNDVRSSSGRPSPSRSATPRSTSRDHAGRVTSRADHPSRTRSSATRAVDGSSPGDSGVQPGHLADPRG